MLDHGAIAISAGDGVAVAHRTWRSERERFATVIAKVTLSLVPDGRMDLAAPERVRASEIHHRNNPMLSVRSAAETAPLLGRADLLFAGSAYAPAGRPTTALRTRWAIMRGDSVIFDKSLDVIGERRARPPETPGDPEPFTSMPLVYERAFGGIGLPVNPLGVGAAPGPDGWLYLPNIVAPPGSNVAPPAGYAPLSSSWPMRKRRLGARRRADIEKDEALIGTDLDLAYFQAAPPDQQADYLRGDELILLKHLHPEIPALMSTLPSLTCAGVAAVDSGDPMALAFVADTLFLDGDRATCSVVYRARLPLPSGSVLRAAVGVGIDAKPPVLPDVRSIELPSRSPAVAGPAQGFGTLLLEQPALVEPSAPGPALHALAQTAEVEAAGPMTLPFLSAREARPEVTSEPTDIPGAPWSPGDSAPPPSARKAHAATLVLEVEPLEVAQSEPPMPVEAMPPPAEPMPPPAEPMRPVDPAPVAPPAITRSPRHQVAPSLYRKFSKR